MEFVSAFGAEMTLSESIWKRLWIFTRLHSVYDVLSDMEKKQFYNALLTDIQIYEEEQDKQIIKSIGFKFPVFYVNILVRKNP